MSAGWQFWVDRGGTFTDIVGRTPAGRIVAAKLLSIAPGRYQDATVTGIRALLAAHGRDGAPIDCVRVGTTVATNALLERQGAVTALVITRGLGDVLAIGTQERPQLFAREIRLPAPLYAHVIEARERVTASGEVLEPLDGAALGAALAAARAAGATSVAIALLHGWQHPAHEREAARLARAAGFAAVAVSHEVAPLEGLVPRGQTTVADAYLAVLVGHYVTTLAAELAALSSGTRLELMQSHGGLAAAAAFRGPNAVLSGPAGGLVGMVKTGTAAGFRRLIGFDMGGTSTDVSLYDGRYARRSELAIGGVRLQVSALDIHTVAAGGGSVLRFADGRCAVGPDSAGAVPGPASYGRGGPLAVTDIHVLLGRLRPERLPSVFGLRGEAPLDAGVVRQRFASLADEMAVATGIARAAEEVAEGFLTVAVDTMANAIKHVSLGAGHDPSQFTLACFGGAGGQHACRVAAALGIDTIFIDPLAGVLSAVGIGLAEPRALRRGTLGLALDAAGVAAATRLAAELAGDAREALKGAAETGRECRAEIRVADSDVALPVEFATPAAMAEEFRREHARRFGYRPADESALVIAAVSVELVGGADAELPPLLPTTGRGPAAAPAHVDAWFDGRYRSVPLFIREQLAAAARIEGPAIIAEATATTIVEPQWSAQVVAGGALVLRRERSDEKDPVELARADPVLVEVFGGLYMHVAEQMGTVLRQTASSVNIRERLDYSCAVFDAGGRLVANAPHMPVHLGSMGASVRAVRDRHGAAIRAGDAFLVNSPYAGGTHLPDLTVVSPVHLEESPVATFWVASRAHHADVGGITPGSMPPFSRRIDEEGALFEGERIVSNGRFEVALVRELLGRGRWPARNIARNLADLAAQLAANARGAGELARLVREQGRAAVTAYMGHVQANAEARVRAALRALAIAGQGPKRHERELDGGERLVVTITVEATHGSARIDFTGTSPQSERNFNAPRAVCTAAVLYVFRTLVDSDIPLNEGCLAPLELVIPAGSLLDPRPPAAVVAGNVETSQCIVDLLYGALGVLADSQGTMNNFTFGDAECQYYETIAGGAGAGPGFAGASGVQTHMTNSRLTDPEVLESRLPVLLREFRYRRGSGGSGRWRGGDGLVRRIEFRRPLAAAILANHRRIAPRGLAGGGNGECGRTTVRRVDGTAEVLGATDAVSVAAGDQIEIETPGGGGYGPPAGEAL
ncbi:MAG TPA: hydantoinase B/oxoprolinase family protein [Steroidobacteraceae bacterium]|nr:hydantoinase B/oxoprolinase family protein [Steroidobacteraceae bacterium]